MDYVLGTDPHTPKEIELEARFLAWLPLQRETNVDTETNITRDITRRMLLTLQIGGVRWWHDSSEAHIEDRADYWFLSWAGLSIHVKLVIRKHLESYAIVKNFHNVAFDYTVFLKKGIICERVYDTYIAEKIIYSGYTQPRGFYKLKELAERHLCLSISKEEQTSFRAGGVYTQSQIDYALTDVKHLHKIKRFQIEYFKATDQEWVAGLEMEAVLAFTDTTWNGFGVNTEAWLKLSEILVPEMLEAKDRLNQTMVSLRKMRAVAIDRGWYFEEARVNINWNSPEQKRQALSVLVPWIENTNKLALRKVIKLEKAKDGYYEDLLKMEQVDLLQSLVDKEHTGDQGSVSQVWSILEILGADAAQTLADKDLLVAPGTVKVNWGSPDQALTLLKTIWPSINDTREETLARKEHPILSDLNAYRETAKAVNTYGEQFLAKHLYADGKVRTEFNLILTTGRVSSSNPNMQNIPGSNAYRNCFIADPGWSIVDSDYASQELVIIAYITREPIFMDALSKGEDLHSICAELIYAQDWIADTEPECIYHSHKQKCSCKGHKNKRQAAKSINFGLAYGMTEYKLASELRISVDNSRLLMTKYFQAFPNVKKVLDSLGNYAMMHGFSRTLPPFRRRRYYPFWKQNEDKVSAHLSGEANSELAQIGRQGKNHPIQGTAADQIKVGMVLVRAYINKQKLRPKIRITMQVHDQITTSCRDELAEWWLPKLHGFMVMAALLSIPTGLLGAETTITGPIWKK